MFIKRLTLKGYRSYKNITFDFDSGLNILIGKNAQGKTNVLEAIFFAVIGKSFKTSKEKEVINWEKESAYIKAEFQKNIERLILNCFLIRYTKKQSK